MLSSIKIAGVAGVIIGTDISVTVPYGTDVSSLAVTYTLDTVGDTLQLSGSQVAQGAAIDFSAPVLLTVANATAGNTDYTITVSIAANTEALIKGFSIGDIAGVINGYQINVATGYEIGTLTPTVITSDNATYLPAGATDFSAGPVIYTVTAEDGVTSNTYTVYVTQYPLHNYASTIFDMLLARMPFLADTAGNRILASSLILETMYELEQCFKIATGGGTVGDESSYTELQKSIIADIITVRLLVRRSTEISGGTAGSEGTPGLFISEAKAGSASVRYEQFKLKDTATLAVDANALIMQYKQDALRKLGQVGCVYDWAGELVLQSNVEFPRFEFIKWD